jgi:hypothetical protein
MMRDADFEAHFDERVGPLVAEHQRRQRAAKKREKRIEKRRKALGLGPRRPWRGILEEFAERSAQRSLDAHAAPHPSTPTTTTKE